MRTSLLDMLAGAATVLALVAASNGVFAQSANRPPDMTPPDKYGPPIGGNPPQQQAQPVPGDDSGSLSNHLSGSGGVVQPPPTHDKGVIPPPSAGPNAMPVITPDAPNDNRGVEPK